MNLPPALPAFFYSDNLLKLCWADRKYGVDWRGDGCQQPVVSEFGLCKVCREELLGKERVNGTEATEA